MKLVYLLISFLDI